MKKRLIVLVILIGFGVSTYAQQTVVIQNSQVGTNSQQTGEFFINGISSKEDIGGVDATGVSDRTSRFQGVEKWDLQAKFKNYNSFAVTVLYKAGKDNITGSVVLQPNEERMIKFGSTETGLGGNLGTTELGVVAITRKLNNTGTISTDSDKIITLLGYLHVFPDDLGEFSEYPKTIIDNINANAAYGYDNWRLPTEQELRVMYENAEKLGLKQSVSDMHFIFCYMYVERSEHEPGYLRNVRLVTTGRVR